MGFLGGVAERVSPYVPPNAANADPENADTSNTDPEKQAVGQYLLTHDGVIVSELMSRTSKELSKLAKNCVVEVSEIVRSSSDERVRAKIVEPLEGWISLAKLTDRYNFAVPQRRKPPSRAQTSDLDVAAMAASRGSFKYSVLIVALAGLFSALWSPAAAFFIVGGNVDAFTSIFYFNWGQLAAVVALALTRRAWHPLNSISETWQKFRAATWRQHVLCIVAGVLNGTGVLCNFLAGSASSFAQAFGIAMCAPVITTLIGAIVLGELRGRSCAAKLIIAAMCAFYLLGIAFIANSAA